MCDRPHRQLDREAGEKRQPHQRLRPADDGDAHHPHGVGVELIGQQRRDVGGASLIVHGDQRHQHQHRAEEGVEEELEGSVDPLLAAPDADDQEHRDQASLEEQVKEDQIERAEHAEHQRLKHQEGDQVFLDPVGHLPARQDGDRHQDGGQDHEQDRDAVDAHLVMQPADPGALLDELEAGVARIEAEQHDQRQQEGDGGHDQRQALGVQALGLAVAAQEDEKHHRADQRQEGDEREQAVHQWLAPMLSHAMISTRPITIAKA